MVQNAGVELQIRVSRLIERCDVPDYGVGKDCIGEVGCESSNEPVG